MQVWSIRTLFILCSTTLGGFLGYKQALTGFILSFGIVSVEYILKRNFMRVILICLIGLLFGLVVASLLINIGGRVGINHPAFAAGSALVLSYIGMMAFYHKGGGLNFTPALSHNALAKKQDFNILDTSVLIDGRIKDMCRTGFIEGTILVPRFVLEELQYIADSHDRLRRNKGRRGFSILKEMQKDPDIDVQLTEEDFPDIDYVDPKLIQLAQNIGAKVITIDFNLNRTAELQAITVLNINELAESVKQVVMEGERITVRVRREGRDFNQGVGYLDDGTMVIIEDGEKYIGRKIEVVVRTILTTEAGIMIFARKNGENNRRHSGGWSQRKNGGR